MTLSRLSLSSYRNYDEAMLEPSAGFNVLSGENGAGKTNILEAVSMLVPGRGLRRASLKEIAQDSGGGGFSVSCLLQDDVSLGTGSTADAPERRRTKINGVDAPATELAQWLSVIWITPAMDRLFQEGAGNRRRFLDRLVLALDPSHARNSSRYDMAMRNRNRLLSDDTPPDPQWLTALEEQMAEFGALISAARHRMLTGITARLAQTENGPFAKPTLALLSGAPQSQDELRSLLMNGRIRERAAKRTLSGPHRDDLLVHHMEKQQEAAKCSTGEQKALLLSIILAHAALVEENRQQRPILLLDEVAAHLDPVRRKALFGHLEQAGGQVWMTGTERELFDGLPETSRWFSIHHGQVSI